jgi:hypothetical protein
VQYKDFAVRWGYRKGEIMEIITTSILVLSFLTILGVDASHKRREFLRKQNNT